MLHLYPKNLTEITKMLYELPFKIHQIKKYGMKYEDKIISLSY